MSGRIVDILNDSGKVIDTVDLDIVHTQGLLHCSIHVLVVNRQGCVFVRQRPLNKPIYPGLWTTSVGTHVLTGATPATTAVDGLKYFLGLEAELANLGEKRVHDAYEKRNHHYIPLLSQ